jgi:hypothetical protein
MTTIDRWRGQHWSPPDFFDQLLTEGEIDCLDELIRSFTYFTIARLQLLSDPRSLNEQEAKAELRNLKDSCRQVGAERMAFICAEMEKGGLNRNSLGFRYLMDTLRDEGHGVMHAMRVYAIEIKTQAMSATASSRPERRLPVDSALSNNGPANNLFFFTPLPELQQRISRIVRVSHKAPAETDAKKM